MSTLDKAREAVKRARQAISEPYPSTDAGLEHLVAAVEALVSAATPAIETSEVGKRHFFEQPGDENYAEFVAKAGAEIDAEIIADLEQRLAEKERRIGELEGLARCAAAIRRTFKASEDDGYRSRDRQFALDMFLPHHGTLDELDKAAALDHPKGDAA